MRGLAMQPERLYETWADRKEAAQSYLEAVNWPNGQTEAWKFTSLSHLSDVVLNPPKQSASIARAARLHGEVLNFTAGLAPDLAAASLPAGIIATDISADKAICHKAFALLPDNHHLTALSASRQTAAVKIEVVDSAKIDKPLILQFTDGKTDEASHPFVFIDIADGAHLHLAELHEGSSSLSQPLILVRLGEGATLDHIKLQDEAAHTTHLGLTLFRLDGQANVNSFSVSKGSQITRMETHCFFAAPDAQAAMSAVYLGCDRQHHDITTVVSHEYANCASRQLIRGVLDDKARGVFQGRVRVAPDAQKTDGQQMSRALLLSRDAEADAKPELEIFADDVVCSHGATVGELDEALLFYLKSRGIDEAEARTMLIDAFLVDTLEEISYQPFADFLRGHISGWTARQTGVE
ncbi:MAG: Fe-S cluster assembly protein SufD [Alphaproteobacteria bacterium]|nr:Fe-S cluster assembly protein SufD [Alphaproteobacteria bacterium]